MTGEESYRHLLSRIYHDGEKRPDRTGTGTLSLFGGTLRAQLTHNKFPLLTSKALPFRSICIELLWMIGAGHSARPLQEQGVNIWNEWADPETGELGPVYGYQWRKWTGYDYEGRSVEIDQLAQVIESLKKDPYGRRHIVSAWNTSQLTDMALPPCPVMFQFLVDGHRGLHTIVTQRSADMFLGVPFDLAEYALLTRMVGVLTGLTASSVQMNFGDAHIYLNHLDQVKELLSREPRQEPVVILSHKPSIDDFTLGDILLFNYDPHPVIRGRISV